MKIKGVLSIVIILGLVWIMSFYASGFITGKLIKRDINIVQTFDEGDSLEGDNSIQGTEPNSLKSEEIICKCHCKIDGTHYNLKLSEYGNGTSCEDINGWQPCRGFDSNNTAAVYQTCEKQTIEETEKIEDSKDNILVRFFRWAITDRIY